MDVSGRVAMYNLQILNVTISRFRGIPGEVTIPLHTGLTVIYAAMVREKARFVRRWSGY